MPMPLVEPRKGTRQSREWSFWRRKSANDAAATGWRMSGVKNTCAADILNKYWRASLSSARWAILRKRCMLDPTWETSDSSSRFQNISS